MRTRSSSASTARFTAPQSRAGSGIALYAVGRSKHLKRRAAHVSGWLQIALAVGAFSEVIRRFVFGSEPEPGYMIVIALAALAANVSCMALIARHREGAVHMKASWIF